MEINARMQDKNMTPYRLAKESGVPYATVHDICSGKAQLEKCAAETVYRIAKALGVSVESILEPRLAERIDFELFKSRVCHRLKERGDLDFITELLEKDEIRSYYERKWYPESLYLLAMLDYLSRENGVSLCTRYDDLRGLKLKTLLFPAGVQIAARVAKNDEAKRRSLREAIPEFLRFNIVESEVRNVV